MPLPLLFIGAAALTGATGLGKTVKAGVDTANAKKINSEADSLAEAARDRLNRERAACGKALEELGKEKVCILNTSVTSFLETFRKIRNVDLREVEELSEIGKLHIDQKTFDDMEEMTSFAASLAGGAAAGTAGGAMTAFGAYSAATSFAAASTGTAISSLSGAAATNATLAFFGGGSLASGGLGMAGGTMVLGGLVAGPALLVTGLIVSAQASKNLEKALCNQAKARELAEQLDAASFQCQAIRRRTCMVYSLLAWLDAKFFPMVFGLEDAVAREGTDFRTYSHESKKTVSTTVTTAKTIMTILNTALLTEEGNLTEESEGVLQIADTMKA